jgi:hypothetical protein
VDCGGGVERGGSEGGGTVSPVMLGCCYWEGAWGFCGAEREENCFQAEDGNGDLGLLCRNMCILS